MHNGQSLSGERGRWQWCLVDDVTGVIWMLWYFSVAYISFDRVYQFINLSQQMQVFQTLGVHWSVSAPSTRVPKTILQHLVYTKQLTHGVKIMKWNTIHDLEYTLLFLRWKDLLILFFQTGFQLLNNSTKVLRFQAWVHISLWLNDM